MRACWAECLGNCSDKISREHVVSQSLFPNDDVITVSGFSWCKEPKKIGLANVTAKILCKKRNSELSEIDSIGGSAFGIFREAQRLTEVRTKLKPTRWNIQRYSIDGFGLERWFLKTLINLSTTQAYRIGKDSTEVGQPSKRLVRIAFGLSQFEGKSGLFGVVDLGSRFNSHEILRFGPLVYDETYVAGGLFHFYGYRFVLFLDPEGPRPGGVNYAGQDWSSSLLHRHASGLKMGIGKHISHIVDINWNAQG
jgi:hypothetical protein